MTWVSAAVPFSSAWLSRTMLGQSSKLGSICGLRIVLYLLG